MAHDLELATGRVLRPSAPDDAPRLVAMFERCSRESVYGRFLAPLHHFPAAHLTDVVRSSKLRGSWVVDDCDTGDLVAVASWFRTELRAAELGILVEDAAQRQGVGSELLDAVVDSARRVGITTLIGTALADAHHVRRMFERLGPMTSVCSGLTCEYRVDLSTR